MFKKLYLVLVTGLFLTMMSSYVYAQAVMEFHLPVFPPYTFEKDGKIQGIAVELVGQILKEAGIQYTIDLVPNYGRAIANVKIGLSDGFFLASQNSERDNIAVFSNPVTNNNWCWFYPVNSKLDPKDGEFKANAKVGTILNANTHKWLKKMGIM
jgi:polar amino acid transport system substrate-binding protein